MWHLGCCFEADYMTILRLRLRVEMLTPPPKSPIGSLSISPFPILQRFLKTNKQLYKACLLQEFEFTTGKRHRAGDIPSLGILALKVLGRMPRIAAAP